MAQADLPNSTPADPTVFDLIAAHREINATLHVMEEEFSFLLEHNLPVRDGVMDEPAAVALVTYLQVNKQDPWKFEGNYATPLIATLATAFNRTAAA
jgi:hypothetical protein